MANKKSKGTTEREVLSTEDVDIIRNKEKEEKMKIFEQAMAKSEIKVECRQLKDQSIAQVEVIPTGVLSVDRALRTFGFPRGRIIELYGEEGSGKTMLSLLAAGNVQRAGGLVALFDMECAYDHSFGQLLGVTNDIYLVRPESAEQAFDKLVEVIDRGVLDLIIVDSVANMVPQAEIDGEMGDSSVALLARIMAKGLRKVTNAIARTKTCLIFINQIRMKVGVMFGDPRTTTGGKSLPFYASQRIEVTAPSGGKIHAGNKKEGEIIGHHAHIVVRKNKVGPPFGEGDMYVYYNLGIDVVRDVCTVGKEEGIINGTTWLEYKSDIYKADDGIIKIQGMENFIEFMRDHRELIYEIREKVISKITKEREEFQKQRNMRLEEAQEKEESGIEE